MDSAIDAGKPAGASTGARPPITTVKFDWAPIIWFSILLLASYVAVLYSLGLQWAQDEDVSHGPFVPAVAAYIAWQRRKEFAETPKTPNYWGLVIVFWAVIQLLIGTLGVELFLQRTSLIISIVGIVLFLGGTQILKLAAFPIFLLVFMVPLPKVIYGEITLPLQLFASSCAETVLTFLGIPVLREGNILELANKKLNVVEACSGIRSLMALSFLSLFYGFFFDDKPWMKWVLLAATVPIAILANASRVAITGILTEWNPALADGLFHLMEGWVIFVVAGVMLFLTHKLINFVYGRLSKKSPSVEGATV